MNIILLETPFETGMALTHTQLVEQAQESMRVMSYLNRGDYSDPCVRMYVGHMQFLKYYSLCLSVMTHPASIDLAKKYSDMAMIIKPAFHTQQYVDHWRKKLSGQTDIDWYYNPFMEKWEYYQNGEKIKTGHTRPKICRLTQIKTKVKEIIDNLAERL